MIPGPAPSTDPTPPDATAGLLPPASTTELTLTLIWRLVLTLASGAGLILMFAPLRTPPQILNQVLYFTTISTILVFLVALFGLLRPLFFLTFPARRKLEGNLGWLRGLSTCASLLTGLVFGFIISGNLSTPTSFIPHLALPVLSAIDWTLVGRNQSLLPWWVPLTWTLSLVPYLFIYAERQTHVRLSESGASRLVAVGGNAECRFSAPRICALGSRQTACPGTHPWPTTCRSPARSGHAGFPEAVTSGNPFPDVPGRHPYFPRTSFPRLLRGVGRGARR